MQAHDGHATKRMEQGKKGPTPSRAKLEQSAEFFVSNPRAARLSGAAEAARLISGDGRSGVSLTGSIMSGMRREG